MEKKYWLIGQTKEKFSGNKLPRSIDVLRVFFHQHLVCKDIIKTCTIDVTRKIIYIWRTAGIPIVEERSIVRKLKLMLKNFAAIKKNNNRKTETQANKENRLKKQLYQLFDVSIKNAEESLCENKKNFLLDQRLNRKLKIQSDDQSIVTGDTTLTTTQVVATNEIESMVAAHHLEEFNEMENEECSDLEEELAEEENDDFESTLSSYFKSKFSEKVPSFLPKLPRNETILGTIIKSNEVCSTLDRITMSSPEFIMLAASIGRALGEDISRSVFSRSTLDRKRNASRNVICSKIKEEFHEKVEPPIVIHFDGKLMEDYTNPNRELRKAKVDRVAIVATGYMLGKTKLL